MSVYDFQHEHFAVVPLRFSRCNVNLKILLFKYRLRCFENENNQCKIRRVVFSYRFSTSNKKSKKSEPYYLYEYGGVAY